MKIVWIAIVGLFVAGGSQAGTPQTEATQRIEQARKFVGARQWQQAENAFADLEQSGALTGELLDQAVEASSQLNHWDRVSVLFENARNRQPLEPHQRELLSEAYLKSGRPAEAERELASLRTDYPAQERLAHLLAFLYLSTRRFSEAVSLYEQYLAEKPAAVESHVNVALILFKLERGQEALAHLKKAFAGNFQQANEYFYRQLVRNMPPQGLAQLADDVKAELGFPRDGATAHRYLGLEYQNLNRYDPAIAEYEAYVAAGGEDQEVRFALAKLYHHTGQDERSQTTLEPLLNQTGPFAAQAALLAAELAVRSGRFQKAAELLSTLTPSYHNQPLYQFLLARVALEEGDEEKAATLLQQSISSDPELVEAYYHLGQIYLRRGEIEKGRELLQEFQRRKP